MRDFEVDLWRTVSHGWRDMVILPHAPVGVGMLEVGKRRYHNCIYYFHFVKKEGIKKLDLLEVCY